MVRVKQRWIAEPLCSLRSFAELQAPSPGVNCVWRQQRSSEGVLGLCAVVRPRGISELLIVCPLARFICSARTRSVPAGLLPVPRANQQRGPRDCATRARSSPPPPPAEHSWIPDKGQGSGEGSSALFVPPPLLPHRGLCPSNSRFLKEPRPARRVPSGSELAAGNLAFSSFSLASVQTLTW